MGIGCLLQRCRYFSLVHGSFSYSYQLLDNESESATRLDKVKSPTYKRSPLRKNVILGARPT